MRCFYDADEQIDLWGKYLAEELPAIYAERAAAVVVFVSAEYAARDWTRLERRAALNRAVQERREYVLPARFDDTPLPGLLSDLVAIDLRGRSPQQFAAMIADKVARLAISAGQQATDTAVPRASAPAPPPPGPVPVPPSHLAQTLTGHARTLTGHDSRSNGVAFSPDGRLLATASDDETARVWDPTTGEHLRTLTGHADAVHGVAFSPDGRLLATASDDKTARLWDPATGEHLRTLTGHDRRGPGGGVQPGRAAARHRQQRRDGAAVGPGHRRAPAHPDRPHRAGLRGGVQPGRAAARHRQRRRTARLWDPATGEHLRTLTGHTGEVYGVAFSPDGRLLATASDDKTARLWDPATGEHLRTLTGHTDPVRGVAFSPDGRLLATASEDKTARLWDPATGEHLRTLTGHTRPRSTGWRSARTGGCSPPPARTRRRGCGTTGLGVEKRALPRHRGPAPRRTTPRRSRCRETMSGKLCRLTRLASPFTLQSGAMAAARLLTPA